MNYTSSLMYKLAGVNNVCGSVGVPLLHRLPLLCFIVKRCVTSALDRNVHAENTVHVNEKLGG